MPVRGIRTVLIQIWYWPMTFRIPSRPKSCRRERRRYNLATSLRPTFSGLTSVGATLRGYTVVVPIDTTSDATECEIVIGQYQILNQNSSNAANEPLKAKASTLSRTDLVTFE